MAGTEEHTSMSVSKRRKLSFDDDTGIVQLVREQPPEHCILKIDSLSTLQDAMSKTSKNHINSTEFEAGGYTWVLSVYPKGNKREGGGDHLSLYVTLIDKLYSGAYVDASLRFYIYDQLRGTYLTFFDVTEKRFHATKTTWGIPKAVPLDTFTDPFKGFLLKDCCAFGAGVIVREGLFKGSTVSLLESECERRYTWKIDNFSDLNNDPLYSPVFSFSEWSWKLLLYPRGTNSGKGKDLSLFLVQNNADDLTYGSNLYTRYCLYIKNQDRKGADHKKWSVSTWFDSEADDSGFSSFISVSDLYDTSKGLLVNDTLIVEVEIKVMLLLSDDMDCAPKKIESVDSI